MLNMTMTMILKCYIIIFLLLVIAIHSSINGQKCYVLYGTDNHNKRLWGWVYQVMENIDMKNCFNRCVRRSKCQSVNHNIKLGRCELNGVVEHNDTNYFIREKRDWFYVKPLDEIRMEFGTNKTEDCSNETCRSGAYCDKSNDNSSCVQDWSFCDESWLYFQGHCYSKSVEMKPITNATADCKTHNASLVDIRDEEKNSWLNLVLLGFNYTDANDEYFWIGLVSLYRFGISIWSVDNTIATYTNWESFAPNGPNERCVVVHYKTSKRDDWDCGSNVKFVCKKRCTRL